MKKSKKLILAVVVLLVIIAGYVVIANDIIPLSGVFSEKKEFASDENGWNLIVVNRNYYMPEDYEVELKELSNGEKVDVRIYPDLQEMFDAARAYGLDIAVSSGYRTSKEQQSLFDEKVQAFINDGCSRSNAKKYARQWVAIPGTSEHQLGLAADICSDSLKTSDEEVYEWLNENAYKYGFILRYPEDKTELTETGYEPWHYRYVGHEVAEEMYESGVCLEEYMEEYDG